ncbi:Uncharacterised protein [Bordetella pertussis]|nr:Uncharacterised protein [Bordetella pertussis]CFO37596.1 Uncharacterised protein [Bordetella pertussis]CFP13196.1 Uncharacterised protein [Bordetella pertussis]CFP51199.1 Uncharacterised protein [Bordetella pertussis]CFU09672.1 Uncharacterised protein [Bordetella pertussis]
MVNSLTGSRPTAPSNQAKNSHSAAPSCSMAARTLASSASLLRDLYSVEGLMASMRGTAGSMAWKTPQVTRAGSISSVWSVCSEPSASAASP